MATEQCHTHHVSWNRKRQNSPWRWESQLSSSPCLYRLTPGQVTNCQIQKNLSLCTSCADKVRLTCLDVTWVALCPVKNDPSQLRQMPIRGGGALVRNEGSDRSHYSHGLESHYLIPSHLNISETSMYFRIGTLQMFFFLKWHKLPVQVIITGL